MQGQISGKGHLQGSVNPTGNLQGTMSTESLIGGQVVGMRGLKGDKGDKGDTGEQGERGYGIISIVYNADKTITITYADGETVTTDVLQGEKGDTGDKGDKGDTGSTGATGNGIASAILNADYTLTLTFTDGTTYTTPSIRGQKGDTGDTGQQGEQGVQGETGNGISSITKTATVGKVDTYTITFTDGTTTTFDVKNGEDGQGSGDMLKYDYDSNEDGKVNASDVADSVAWSGVTGKPEDYPPSSHNHTKSEITDFSHTHDDRYYTENEVDTALSEKSNTWHTHTKSDVTDFPALSTVATSGSYNDLSNKPTIPTVNNATLTIQKNGTSVGTFTANASSNVTANVTVPTKTSELTNDSNFTTASGHNHDSRYYTESEIDTALSGKANTSHTHTKSQITDFPSLLALGETSTTAYRGDRGKTAYDHSQTAHAPSTAEANVQSNWTETNTSSDAYIKNKPSTFPPSSHNHTKSEITDFSHTHDDRYYTETEINNKGEFVKYLTGSGTTASSSGGVYYPAKWTFNAGITPASGKLISIKIPVAGHDYGVYLSTNNGTNYYPVVISGTSRLTTHYGASTKIMLIYDADGSASSMYPVAGGSSRVTVSGGVWRIVNYYDANTYTSALCTTSASTQAKTASSSNFVLTAKRYLYITIANANTYNGAITLNVNSTGAKPIYINGKASSSSNKTLPAGSYLAYYDGTRYNFRTDGNDTSTLYLSDCTITDSGTALSVTAGATTDDGKLAQAVIDAFDYATAKEILEV